MDSVDFHSDVQNGLAYEKEMPLNWCPNCKAVLANEEATNGVCDRCGATVTKKNLRQWMLRITKHADRLLNDLDKLDWPEKVKKMQSDWIGKSYGAEIDFLLMVQIRLLRFILQDLILYMVQHLWFFHQNTLL